MIADEIHVLELVGGGYMVRSKSVPGAWRIVHGRTCSCPAGEKRTCRHRRLVEKFCRLLDAKFQRPSAPPHVAALCD